VGGGEKPVQKKVLFLREKRENAGKRPRLARGRKKTAREIRKKKFWSPLERKEEGRGSEKSRTRGRRSPLEGKKYLHWERGNKEKGRRQGRTTAPSREW